MKNLEIAKIFKNIAQILELQEVAFKPQAYRNAAQSIESLSEDIASIYERGELEKIPCVGKHIAIKIAELIDTDKLRYYEKLKKEVKIDIENLSQVPGLGPKKLQFFYKKFKVKNLNDLEKLLKSNKLQKEKGYGEKTQLQLLEGVSFVKKRPKRFLYAHVVPIVREIETYLKRVPRVSKVEVAGSFRRGKETVGDLDFLAISLSPKEVMKSFTNLPDIAKVISKGTTRSSIRLKNGLQVDLRVVKEKEFGSAMLYFIGNKNHNVSLRKLALKQGYTLSEYGLFKVKNKRWVAGRTEEEVYKRLKLQYIPPQIRRNLSEIDAAKKNQIPKLVTKKNVKGIFHNHTTWSDGVGSMSEMVKEAEKLKLKFISFNDHFGPLGIANPLNEKRLNGYLKQIEKVRKKTDLKIFSGVEIEILKDGTLPLSASKLKNLDVVVASVHLANKMKEKEMTKRVLYAMENYPINILGHPTDRLIQKRKSLNLDLGKVFETAKEQEIFLEINSSPLRLDLNGDNIKAAKEVGCKFAISTDSHDPAHLAFYGYGVTQARRGWLEKKHILNCYSMTRIEKSLSK